MSLLQRPTLPGVNYSIVIQSGYRINMWPFWRQRQITGAAETRVCGRHVRMGGESEGFGKTVDLLIKEDFDSMEALILIDSDDLSQTKIQRGQQKLLLKYLLSLQSTVLRRRHGICGGDGRGQHDSNGHPRSSGRDHRVERDARWREARNTRRRDARNTGGRGPTRRRLHALGGGPHAFNGFHSVWSHSDKPRSLETCPLSRCPSSRYPFGRCPKCSRSCLSIYYCYNSPSALVCDV